MSNFLILLVGPSGSGKTTIADILSKKYGLRSIESYTTRPARYKGEKGHIFITEQVFNEAYPDGESDPRIVAYTYFNGNHYFATCEQVDNAEVYVIDPTGVRSLQEKYKGNKVIVPVWLNIDPESCRQRMLLRGDSPENVENRLLNDRVAFKEKLPHACYVSAMDTPERLASKIYDMANGYAEAKGTN